MLQGLAIGAAAIGDAGRDWPGAGPRPGGVRADRRAAVAPEGRVRRVGRP